MSQVHTSNDRCSSQGSHGRALRGSPPCTAQGLINLALMVNGDWGRAEDTGQEALVRVYPPWSRLEDPLAYARRTVVNATRDDWRRAGRATRAYEDAGQLSLYGEADDVETSVLDRDVLRTALVALAHRPRAVNVPRCLGDVSRAETAAVLDISVGTVKSQTYDALARVRRTFDADLTTLTTTEKEKCV